MYHVPDATADEAQSPLWHRLSSFFSLRRTSTMSTMVKDQHRSSVCSMNSLVCQGSPVQAVPSGRRQKSISGLIRATRRSTRHSSIIRRNGNIIIVKGGKIVSVRRQESFQANIPVVSELADETTDSAPKTNGCANHISPDLSSESLQGQDSAVWKRRSCSSEGSDSVFDDRCNNLACSSDFACDSPLEMISEEKKLLSQTSEAEQECESSLSTNEVCAPAEKASHVDDNSLAGEGAPCYPNRFKTDVGIIINIDEDDSILDIMPLTPRTRDHIIARSDLFLDDGAKAFSGSLTKLKPAHSSQALSKRSLRRLPSVEYLDPPIGLKKASSDNNVQASTKLQQNVRTLKIPIPNPKRWSFGRKFDKKQAENV
ncbi:hypothetical protein C0Q70_09239 [Pomacea canaliculata]|uniref:Uncharacterized protein n=1 Tax=Pomacea canaliculata TaxID=400727 RepID=A0A2T7P984_POMCA|nr:hypothetical protein C0Q70_09239 [Pomacea canaliculata]